MGKRSKTGPSEPIDIAQHEEIEDPVELDNPLRIVIIINSADAPEGDMEERLMDYVQSMDEVDDFFNEFDETVAIPNEGHIKYEVGSDGLVVIVVDNKELQGGVLKFIDEYNDKLINAPTKGDEATKKARK